MIGAAMNELWASIAVSVATYLLQAIIGRLLDWGERQRTLTQTFEKERRSLMYQRDRAEKRANEFAKLVQELQDKHLELLDKHLEQDKIIESLQQKLRVPPGAV